MMTGLLLGLACETATPLPPRARDTTHVAAQMVAAGEVRGYLVRTEGSVDAHLLLTTSLDEDVQARAKIHTGSTVLAITPTTDTAKSVAYLEGLPGIERVTVACERKVCPDLNPGAAQSSP